MKKIIYTTDFSENSTPALKYAVTLAKLLGDDVIALHVYPPQEENGMHKPEERKPVREKHQNDLLNFCKKHLGDQYDASSFSVAAIKGANTSKAISDFVRDLNIRMIVMGACGTSTLKEVFMGSTTKEMMEVSPFPILAVPAGYKPGKVEKVFFASVLDNEDIEHLAELVQIISSAQPEIQVVHITHKEARQAKKALSEFEKKVKEKTNYSKMSFMTIYSEDVFETLKSSIEEIKPDVVVMPEQKEKNEVNKMIIRDKVKHMQSCTKVPLLSFPPTI